MAAAENVGNATVKAVVSIYSIGDVLLLTEEQHTATMEALNTQSHRNNRL